MKAEFLLVRDLAFADMLLFVIYKTCWQNLYVQN